MELRNANVVCCCDSLHRFLAALILIMICFGIESYTFFTGISMFNNISSLLCAWNSVYWRNLCVAFGVMTEYMFQFKCTILAQSNLVNHLQKCARGAVLSWLGFVAICAAIIFLMKAVNSVMCFVFMKRGSACSCCGARCWIAGIFFLHPGNTMQWVCWCIGVLRLFVACPWTDYVDSGGMKRQPPIEMLCTCRVSGDNIWYIFAFCSLLPAMYEGFLLYLVKVCAATILTSGNCLISDLWVSVHLELRETKNVCVLFEKHLINADDIPVRWVSIRTLCTMRKIEPKCTFWISPHHVTGVTAFPRSVEKWPRQKFFFSQVKSVVKLRFLVPKHLCNV